MYWRITRRLDSDFNEINCTSKNNNLLNNACFDNITDNRKLRTRKNRTYAEAVSGTKNIHGESVKDVQKIVNSTLSKKDHKVVGYESIDLEKYLC